MSQENNKLAFANVLNRIDGFVPEYSVVLIPSLNLLEISKGLSSIEDFLIVLENFQSIALAGYWVIHNACQSIFFSES